MDTWQGASDHRNGDDRNSLPAQPVHMSMMSEDVGAGANVVPRMPNWPLGSERNQQAFTHSSFSQRFLKLAPQQGSLNRRGNQLDIAQGPPKRRRSLSLDERGIGTQRWTPGSPSDTEDFTENSGVQSFIRPGNDSWPISGPNGCTLENTTAATAARGIYGTGNESAGVNAGIVAAQSEGKGMEDKPGPEPWQGGRPDSKGGTVIPGTGAEISLIDCLPSGGSKPNQGERLLSGAGSSGLEQRSATGTLGTTGSFGFMGGSSGFGWNGSTGPDGGRSASNRSSGLSEADGVAPGLLWGRGGYFTGRGSRHGLGRDSGSLFSQGAGLGSGQFVKLWGMRHNGVPRARAIAMARAGAFAAAGRGNQAYSLNPPRKPAPDSEEEEWEDVAEGIGNREQGAADGVTFVPTICSQPTLESSVEIEQPLGQDQAVKYERAPEQQGEVDHTRGDTSRQPEPSGLLEQECERRREVFECSDGEERSSETEKERDWGNRVEGSRIVDTGCNLDIPSEEQNVTDVELQEARWDMVRNSNGRRRAGTFVGSNDPMHVLLLQPSSLQLAARANPQPGLFNPPAAPSHPVFSDPESVPVEAGAPGSGLDAPGTSGSWDDRRNAPNSPIDKQTSSCGVLHHDSHANFELQLNSGLKLDVDESSLPKVSSASIGHVLSESGHSVSLGLLGRMGKSKREADSKVLEERVRPWMLKDIVSGKIQGESKRTPVTPKGREEEDNLGPTSVMGVTSVKEGTEHRCSQKDYSMSKRERDSTNERKKLDEAEKNYRRKLEREAKERERERERIFKEKRDRETSTDEHEKKYGSSGKKQKIEDNSISWVKVGGNSMIPPSRPGAGSFMKWLWDVGKGKAAHGSSDVSVSFGLPAEGPVLRDITVNIAPGLVSIASSSRNPTIPVDVQNELVVVSQNPGVNMGRASPVGGSGRDIGAVSTGGSKLGVVPVLKDGDRVEKREHRELAFDKDESPLPPGGEHGGINPTFPDGSHAEPSRRRGMFLMDGGSSAIEPEVIPPCRFGLDQDKDDKVAVADRTYSAEEHRSQFIRSGTGMYHVDCTGQLPQQSLKEIPGTTQFKQDGMHTKPPQHKGATEKPHEVGPGGSGEPEAVSTRLVAYSGGKTARDMWICRFSPKGGNRTANSELQQLGTLGHSPSKQALQHRLPHVPSKGHIPTYREDSSAAPQNGSEATTKPDATGHNLHSGALNLGTLVSDGLRQTSLYEADGSGELPVRQDAMDYSASMNAVKSWRIESGKVIEDIRPSAIELGHCKCWFCGLHGHSIAECSETLDCELRDLVKRAGESGEMVSDGDIVCLRCLSIGHWGAQCHLSVKDAASRAQEKSKSWEQIRTKWMKLAGRGMGRGRVKQREVIHRNARDFMSKDTANVLCYNCNVRGHWARYCPRRRSCSGGVQSSGSPKGQRSSSSSVEKLHSIHGQEKSARTSSSEKSGHAANKSRYVCAHAEACTLDLMPAKACLWESQQWSDVGSTKREQVNTEVGVTPNVDFCGQSSQVGPDINVKVVPESNLLPQASASTKCVRNHIPQNVIPHIPEGMLAAVEQIRLSRPDLQKWVDYPDFGARVEGFFLRVRFGRWEAQLGGTGYRIARILGATKKSGLGKSMVISVDLGESECSVDGQYVSNQTFAEAEFVEWWKGSWRKGGRLLSDIEIEAKLKERQDWP